MDCYLNSCTGTHSALQGKAIFFRYGYDLKQDIFTTAAIQLYPHCNSSLPSQWSKTDVTLLNDWVQVTLNYAVSIHIGRIKLLLTAQFPKPRQHKSEIMDSPYRLYSKVISFQDIFISVNSVAIFLEGP